MRLATPLFLALAVLAMGPQLPGGNPPKDKTFLQGTWEIVDSNLEGEKVAALAKAKIVFMGERMKLTYHDSQGGGNREFNFDVDASKDPMQINVEALDGPLKGTKAPGIYKVDMDLLILALPNKGKMKRPTKFESAVDSGIAIMVLKKLDGK